jgi:hypothetical protein
MENNNKLALIVAYYLSKFDMTAIKRLGYGNTTETFDNVGHKLSVKRNTVKNMRDEFDAIHDNPRQGWYQRPLRPSREYVVDKFKYLTEKELYNIIIEILDNNEFRISNRCLELIEHISDNKEKRRMRRS